MKEIRYAKVNGESIPVVISDETEALLAAKADGRAIIGLAGMDGNPAEFVLERLEDADEEILERAARRHLGLPWTICVTKRLIIREIFADDYEAIWENQVGTPASRLWADSRLSRTRRWGAATGVCPVTIL